MSENKGLGPATPGTAARCEVCNRERGYGKGLCYAHVPDYYDYEISDCFRHGYGRLKAENASLLESLRAAREDAERWQNSAESAGPAVTEANELENAAEAKAAAAEKDRDNFAEQAGEWQLMANEQEQRAIAAEKEKDEAREAANKNAAEGLRSWKERAAAEQRNTELEGALRDIRASVQAAADDLGPDPEDWRVALIHINAALRDEERSAPPEPEEKRLRGALANIVDVGDADDGTDAMPRLERCIEIAGRALYPDSGERDRIYRAAGIVSDGTSCRADGCRRKRPHEHTTTGVVYPWATGAAAQGEEK